jgi:hypothetical protein
LFVCHKVNKKNQFRKRNIKKVSFFFVERSKKVLNSGRKQHFQTNKSLT